MITIKTKQMQNFKNLAKNRWCKTTAQDLFNTYSQYYGAMGTSEETLFPMIQAIANWAQQYKVTSKADVTRLCHVAAALGHRFWQDPRFRSYVAASMSENVQSGRRAQAMTKATKGWLKELWAGDTLEAFSERLGYLVTFGRGPDADAINYLLPSHSRMLATSDHDKLLTWLNQLSPQEVRSTSAQQLAFVACALAHGTQWLSDPQNLRLSEAVRSQSNPTKLAKVITLIYTEATT